METPQVGHAIEPVVPCECSDPALVWSDVYGTSPRRVYWQCRQCHAFGAILLPRISDDEGGLHRWQAEQERELGPYLDALEVESFSYFVNATEESLSRYRGRRPVDVMTLGADTIRRAMRDMRAEAERRINKWIMDQTQRRMEEARRTERLRAQLRHRIANRAPKRIKPIRRAGSGNYEIFCRGSDLMQPIIYGLIDPSEPARVRYVGQSVSPISRFAQHCGTKGNSPKEQWVEALARDGSYPDMVLLERVPARRDMNAREEHWIVSLRAIGQADLNSAVPSERRVEVVADA